MLARRCLRLLTSTRPASLMQVDVGRGLYTDAFMTIDIFKDRRNRAQEDLSKTSLVDVSKTLEKLIAGGDTSVSEGEIINEAVKVLQNAILLSNDEASLDQTANLLRIFMSTYKHICFHNTKIFLLREFLMSCHVNMAPNSATQVWEDQDLISNVELYTHDRKMVKSAPALTLCYLDLLLESQLYDRLFETVDKLDENVETLPFNIMVIYMIACVRQDTQQALARATKMCSKYPESLEKNNKIANAYSYLIFHHGVDPSSALTILSASANHYKHSVVRTCLLTYYLSKMERPQQAYNQLKSLLEFIEEKFHGDKGLEVSSRGQLRFSSQAVEALTEATEATGDALLMRDLTGLFNRLGSIATLSDQSIKELISSEIGVDANMQHKREKNRKRWEKRNSELTAATG